MPLSMSHKMLLLFGGGGAAVQYLLRDEFITDRAAGAVNGTASEPGPGTRNVVDTGGTGVSITGGALRILGSGSWGQRGYHLTPALVRQTGLVLRHDFALTNAGQAMLGLTAVADAGFSGYSNVGVNINGSGSHFARRTSGANSPAINIDAKLSGAFYFVLRAVGRFIFYDAQDGSDVELLWWDEWDNTSSLYIGATLLSANFQCDVDTVLSPSNRFFNISSYVKAADTFNRADGVLGSTDGDVFAEGGGDGIAWSGVTGTWTIASNKAQASALSGGIAIVVINSGSRDALIECDLVRGAGNVGIIARYTDANNYLRAYHDGTNAVLVQVLAGTPATLITGVAMYAANAPIRVHVHGTRALLYYNDLYIGTTNVANVALTGTQHGLYTTDVGNTQDNFVCLNRNGYNAIRLEA